MKKNSILIFCIYVTGFSSVSYYSSPNWSQLCNLNTDLRSTLLDIHDITNKCSSPSFVPSQLAQNKYHATFFDSTLPPLTLFWNLFSQQKLVGLERQTCLEVHLTVMIQIPPPYAPTCRICAKLLACAEHWPPSLQSILLGLL